MYSCLLCNEGFIVTGGSGWCALGRLKSRRSPSPGGDSKTECLKALQGEYGGGSWRGLSAGDALGKEGITPDGRAPEGGSIAMGTWVEFQEGDVNSCLL